MSYRTSAIVLFAIALVFGLVSSFLTTGEAHEGPEDDVGARNTETYTLWGKERNDPNGVVTATGWFDDQVDPNNSHQMLWTAPIFVTVGLAFALTAFLVLIFKDSIAAGWIGGIGVLLFVLGLALHAAGVYKQGDVISGVPGADLKIGAYLFIIAAICYVFAALFAMVRYRTTVEERVSYAGESAAVHTHSHSAVRLKCPDCGTIETMIDGTPTCSGCGYDSTRIARATA